MSLTSNLKACNERSRDYGISITLVLSLSKILLPRSGILIQGARFTDAIAAQVHVSLKLTNQERSSIPGVAPFYYNSEVTSRL